MPPSIFNDFEREVVTGLLDGQLAASVVSSVLEEATLVSLEETGSGYFLTAAHPSLPQERVVCSTPRLTGRLDDLECGFVVFLEGGELTLECHTWTDEGLPEGFRDGSVRIERSS